MEPGALSQHPIDPRLANNQDRQLYHTSPDMTSPKDPRVARADQSNGNAANQDTKPEPYEANVPHSLPKTEPSFQQSPNPNTFPQLNKQEPQSAPLPAAGTQSVPGQSPPPPSNNNVPGGSKIFVGGLSWETDETSLRRYFEGFGEVMDCVIMRDRHTGHPRGFGFVTFTDDAVAGTAASRRHDLDGRQVEAKRAVPRSEFPAQAAAGMLGNVRMGGSQSNSQVRVNHTTRGKVFVGGLPSQCGNDEFKAYFGTYGDVVDAQVMIDHNTGNSRGFGFVTFANESSVDTVVGPGRSNSRHEIMGKCVEVKRAEPKGATASTRTPYGSTIMRTPVGGHGHGSGGAGGNPGNVGEGGRDHGLNNPNHGQNHNSTSGNPSAAAAAYYGNYASASLAEQYGAYYNNPQWQQYYAAMGYNFSAYPQGYNPYTYLQAYMNNVANGSGGAGGNTGVEGAPGTGGQDPNQAGAPGNAPSGAGKFLLLLCSTLFMRLLTDPFSFCDRWIRRGGRARERRWTVRRRRLVGGRAGTWRTWTGRERCATIIEKG